MLFEYALSQEDIKISVPDQANVNKIINGERNIPKDILSLYNDDNGYERLQAGTKQILAETNDPDYIQEQLDNILHWDNSISDKKRKTLLERKCSPMEFITACILFGIFRGIAKKKDDSEKCIVLSDYLIKYKFPSVKKEFYGRQHELHEIHETLQKNDHLFLEGIGGIGKSELARQYGKAYRKKYENILFITYTESLKKTITRLEFVHDRNNMTDTELFHNHYRFFKQLSSETLVILDNFNTVPEYEELFYEFLNLPFQLLVTTRSHIMDVNSYLINEIKSTSELLQLFYIYAPKSKQDETIVNEIIEEVYRHTLTVEMAAKTLTVSDMKPKELLIALRREGLFLSNPNKIKVLKDDELKKERLSCHIQLLFNLQNLSESKQHILKNMVLVSERGIPKKLFHEWLQTNDFNTTNDLIDYGWIQQDSENNQISLHPFICEVLKIFTRPSVNSCIKFLSSIVGICGFYGIDVDYYQDVLNTIETIFKNIEIDNTPLAFNFFDIVIPYFCKYEKFDKMDWALQKMKDTIPMDENHNVEKTTYELYKGIIEMGQNNYQKAIEYFLQGVKTLSPINQEYHALAANLFCNLGTCSLVTQNKILLQICVIYLESFKKYAKLYTHDSVVQDCLIAQSYSVHGEDKKAIDLLEQVLIKTRDIPNFHSTLHFIYGIMGAIIMKNDSLKALSYFQQSEYELSQHRSLEESQNNLLPLKIFMQLAKEVIDGNILVEWDHTKA